MDNQTVRTDCVGAITPSRSKRGEPLGNFWDLRLLPRQCSPCNRVCYFYLPYNFIISTKSLFDRLIENVAEYYFAIGYIWSFNRGVLCPLFILFPAKTVQLCEGCLVLGERKHNQEVVMTEIETFTYPIRQKVVSYKSLISVPGPPPRDPSKQWME